MRFFLLLALLLALVSVCVAVPVKYTLCGSKPLITITSVDSNEWPPKKGTDMNVTVTGSLSKEITKGTYTINVKISGFPLPPSSGDVGAIKPLPWTEGEIDFDLVTPIPAESPSGSYNVKITAIDQDKEEIFCVDMTFSLLEMSNNYAHPKLEHLKQLIQNHPTLPLNNNHRHSINGPNLP